MKLSECEDYTDHEIWSEEHPIKHCLLQIALSPILIPLLIVMMFWDPLKDNNDEHKV